MNAITRMICRQAAKLRVAENEGRRIVVREDDTPERAKRVRAKKGWKAHIAQQLRREIVALKAELA